MGLLHRNSIRLSYTANRIARQHRAWRLIKLVSISLLIASVSSFFILTHESAAIQAKALPAAPTNPLIVSAAPPATPVQVTTSTAPAAASSPAAPSCSRGSYTPPVAPAVSPAQPGLHANVLPFAHYTIYGNTVSQIDGQMAACSPVTAGDGVGQFAASTDYAIAWAYNYQTNTDGTCSLSDVSVGVTVSEILPAWQQTAGAASGMAASWQQFIANLQTHESGHSQLDQTAATNLLSDLQNFPATDCASIAVVANSKAQADLAALNQANDNYDAATNHGATQGAILK